MNLSKLYIEFFNSEKTGGLLLLIVTIISIFLANSVWNVEYSYFWQLKPGGQTIVHWINDGLMAVFFLLIGLELEREVYHGELSDIKKSTLPIFAAIGGMVVPAGIFFLFNFNTSTQAGTGIPTATDIAFAIGILSLLGKRVPASLKIFLTALAVIDDLGAIIIISLFYTDSLVIGNLIISLSIFAFLIALNRFNVKNLIPYIIGGIVMWYFMHHSGVHATITGVLLAFAIPFRRGDDNSPSFKLQHLLHKPVAFIILPLFAAANTNILIQDNWIDSLSEPYSVGIILGMLIGKPLGILFFSFIGVLIGVCTLPANLKWKHITGVGFLGGIGFTMSIFITLLAFDDVAIIDGSKISIIIGSAISGFIGYFILNRTLAKEAE